VTEGFGCATGTSESSVIHFIPKYNFITLRSSIISSFPSFSNLPHPLTQFSFHCTLSHLPFFTLSILLNFHTSVFSFVGKYFHYLVVDHKMNILCWLEETVPEAGPSRQH
jgi:hypothetical protein